MATNLITGALSRRTFMAVTGATLVTACSRTGGGSGGSGGAAALVQATGGQIQGENLGTVNRFLGIPYAQSIAGRNRFAPPQPVEPWSDVLEATRLPQSAPQPPERGNSPVSPAFNPPEYVVPGDDCLALNVWAPADSAGDLPVMVWLHGGGWMSGSGSCPVYDGANLAGRGDVVVVTINHRLGLSGLSDFSQVLGGEFADSSNLSVRDMIAALEWVRDNIAAFGGNPDLVTIFGESGGGFKVSTLLASPAAKGLFHRAIIQSGPLVRFMSQDQAGEVAGQVLEALGITAENPEKLHDLTTQQIVEAQGQVMQSFPMSLETPGFPAGFWPVLDGEILNDQAFDPSAAPSSLDVPLMVGQNTTEFTLFMLADEAAYSLDEQQLQARVLGRYGESDGTRVLATYRGMFPEEAPSRLWFRIVTDNLMGALNTAILDARSVEGAAPAYAYRFDWNTPIMGGALFAPHTIEIPFVFDNVNEDSGRTMTGGGEEVAALAKTVSDAWVEFARTGTPAAEGLPDWPAYSADSRNAMHINVECNVAPLMDSGMNDLFHDKLWQAAGAA